MKSRLTVVASFTALALVAAAGMAGAQAAVRPESAGHAFTPGGHVWLDLSSGDYEIRAGRDDRVWIEWRTTDPDDAGQYKASFESKGNDMLVLTRGPKGSMHVVLEVPARSDLTVELSAGDLRIEGVTGSKDISSWAGNITVQVGEADDYASVDARVTAGDLSARPFNVKKGGLFRSFTWHGRGKHTLKVRLTAGDVTLR